VLGGPYPITATLSPAAVLSNYAITYNTAPFAIRPGPPALIAVVSGSGQTATVAAAFAAPLVVQVTDKYGNAVGGGVAVRFTAPGSGASASVPGSSAITGSDGRATVTATANTIGGSYAITASIGLASATPVNFVL